MRYPVTQKLSIGLISLRDHGKCFTVRGQGDDGILEGD